MELVVNAPSSDDSMMFVHDVMEMRSTDAEENYM